MRKKAEGRQNIRDKTIRLLGNSGQTLRNFCSLLTAGITANNRFQTRGRRRAIYVFKEISANDCFLTGNRVSFIRKIRDHTLELLRLSQKKSVVSHIIFPWLGQLGFRENNFFLNQEVLQAVSLRKGTSGSTRTFPYNIDLKLNSGEQTIAQWKWC